MSEQLTRTPGETFHFITEAVFRGKLIEAINWKQYNKAMDISGEIHAKDATGYSQNEVIATTEGQDIFISDILTSS